MFRRVENKEQELNKNVLPCLSDILSVELWGVFWPFQRDSSGIKMIAPFYSKERIVR